MHFIYRKLQTDTEKYNKKLSCCCDSRSYCMQQYCLISILTLFIVIAASRPVNKNVNTGAVIRAKPGTEPGVHKLLANYQTSGYKNERLERKNLIAPFRL